MSGAVRLLDLRHLGNPGVIGVWLLEGPEPALVDCGPSVCAGALAGALREHGLEPRDVRHLLVTHIHPDHVGGAGELAAANPALRVHVSHLGAPHVVDPARLEESAREVYGDAYDTVFGPIRPVPAANVRVLGHEAVGLEVLPTPGHARHHVSFLAADGACYAGDTAGILMPPGRFLYPAAAPPGVDVDSWHSSLDALQARGPSVLRIAHFGEIADPRAHLERLRARLDEWACRIRAGATVEEFAAAARAELEAEAGAAAGLYRQQPSFEQSYAGLRRSLER